MDKVDKEDNIEDKIKKYETFLEEKLKEDLKRVEEILLKKDEFYQEWEEVENMSKTVKEFKEKDSDMLLKLELSNKIFVHGEVTDLSEVLVDVGLNHLLRMELDEAIKYAEIRKKALRKEVDHYRKLAVDIKVHIKLVLLALNELQSTVKPLR